MNQESNSERFTDMMQMLTPGATSTLPGQEQGKAKPAL